MSEYLRCETCRKPLEGVADKITMKTLLGRWESRGKRYWLELFESDFQGKPSYDYRGDSCAGNYGWTTKENALARFDAYVKMVYTDSGIKLKKVA